MTTEDYPEPNYDPDHPDNAPFDPSKMEQQEDEPFRLHAGAYEYKNNFGIWNFLLPKLVGGFWVETHPYQANGDMLALSEGNWQGSIGRLVDLWRNDPSLLEKDIIFQMLPPAIQDPIRRLVQNPERVKISNIDFHLLSIHQFECILLMTGAYDLCNNFIKGGLKGDYCFQEAIGFINDFYLPPDQEKERQEAKALLSYLADKAIEQKPESPSLATSKEEEENNRNNSAHLYPSRTMSTLEDLSPIAIRPFDERIRLYSLPLNMPSELRGRIIAFEGRSHFGGAYISFLGIRTDSYDQYCHRLHAYYDHNVQTLHSHPLYRLMRTNDAHRVADFFSKGSLRGVTNIQGTAYVVAPRDTMISFLRFLTMERLYQRMRSNPQLSDVMKSLGKKQNLSPTRRGEMNVFLRYISEIARQRENVS